MGTKGKIILWSIVGVIVLSVAGFFGVRSLIRKSKVAPFKEKITAFLTEPTAPIVPGGLDGGPPVVQASSAIKGKVITIDKGERDIDYLYFDLPDDLIAKTPDEVKTVVWLLWGKEQVGTYGSAGGTPAYVQTCAITVIDAETKTVVCMNAFRGGDPPQRKKSSESGTGPKPEKEVIQFLTGLKRQ